MNLGHGELGFGAWPSAKSRPVAEYCTVLRVSTPIAFDAAAIAGLASWADVVHTAVIASADAARHFFNIIAPPFRWLVALVPVGSLYYFVAATPSTCTSS